MNRLKYVYYKGVTIVCYMGSNWVYIDKRPFKSINSAKRYITKKQLQDFLNIEEKFECLRKNIKNI